METQCQWTDNNERPHTSIGGVPTKQVM